jgi:hypothetical protein
VLRLIQNYKDERMVNLRLTKDELKMNKRLTDLRVYELGSVAVVNSTRGCLSNCYKTILPPKDARR